ncbi:hypothetical protein B0H14DRAFT_3472006 [Mycena olivaceomarginata]|nr:hypothetical protein B0H14DRAFT_3472006 [Mycena olivaceomarginata]
MGPNVHAQVTNPHLKYMAVRDLLTPPVHDDDDGEYDNAEADVLAKEAQMKLDLAILEAIKATRYLRDHPHVPKSGNLHLAWEYAQRKEDHGRFQGMLRVSPVYQLGVI